MMGLDARPKNTTKAEIKIGELTQETTLRLSINSTVAKEGELCGRSANKAQKEPPHQINPKN
jgi:hypothetical protein